MQALKRFQQIAESHLKEIEGALPGEYRLTLLARNTEMPDADILLTRDNLDDVQESIEYLKGL